MAKLALCIAQPLRAQCVRETCTCKHNVCCNACKTSQEKRMPCSPSGGDLMVMPLGSTSYPSAGSASPLILTATSLTSAERMAQLDVAVNPLHITACRSCWVNGLCDPATLPRIPTASSSREQSHFGYSSPSMLAGNCPLTACHRYSLQAARMYFQTDCAERLF